MRERKWCCYCKRDLLPTTSKSRLAETRDHTVPKCDGGTKTVPRCRGCNETKGNIGIAEWWRFVHANPDYWKTYRTPAEVRRWIRGAHNDGRSDA